MVVLRRFDGLHSQPWCLDLRTRGRALEDSVGKCKRRFLVGCGHAFKLWPSRGETPEGWEGCYLESE